jgi:hypothetical protein
MEMRVGCGAGLLRMTEIGRESIVSRRRLGEIISVILAITMSTWGCGLGGETGGYVQARWDAGKTAMTLPEVKPGTEQNISFVMNIDQSASSVRLEVAHGALRDMGISIADAVVAVKNGTVSSAVRFIIHANTPARRYVLTILARDAATSRIVARAELPFAVYPYSLHRLLDCSC